MKPANDRSLKDAISELLHEYELEGRINEMKLISCWEKVAGDMITRHTKGLNIRNKKLFVKIDSPALKNELNYSRSKIVEALNAEVGIHVIDEIVFT
jgi:predicted nucleic acid-binding Zn ribbon protein